MAQESRAKERRKSSMQDQYEHDHEHRGESGMFGTIFSVDVPLYKPVPGENEGVIIPYPVKENSIFRTRNPGLNKPFSEEALEQGSADAYVLKVYVHSNCGPTKDNKLCLKTIKERCPYCDRREELRLKRDELKKKDKPIAEIEEELRQVSASKRALYNWLSLNSPKDKKKGVQVFNAPCASIQDVLIDRAKDKRSGEFKDFGTPEEGWNILFDYDKNASDAKKIYSGVDIYDRKKEDALSNDDLNALYNDTFVFDEIIEIPTYEELYQLLYGEEPGGEEKGRRESEEEDKPRRRREESEEEDKPRRRREESAEEEERPRRRREESEEEEDRPRHRREESAEEDRPRRRKEESEEEPEDKPEGGPRKRQPLKSSGEKELEKKSSKGKMDAPDCFGKEYNELDACDDCPVEIYRKCLAETSANTSARRGGGSEDERRPRRSADRERER